MMSGILLILRSGAPEKIVEMAKIVATAPTGARVSGGNKSSNGAAVGAVPTTIKAEYVMSNELRDFADVLTDLRGGRTHNELSEALYEATEAVKKTGKMATVQLTIKLKPQGDRQVEVLDAIKRTIPEPARQPTIMFIDEANRLTRSDVRQMRIDELKVVSEKQKADGLVMVDEKTGELKEVSVQ